MSEYDVIRAWKDEDYRSSLCDADLEMLPSHPSGDMDLSAMRQDDNLKFITQRVVCTPRSDPPCCLDTADC